MLYKGTVNTVKFLHLSDLHIGKRVNEFSMIEDQIYILEQILEIVDEKSQMQLSLQEMSMISRCQR